MAWDWGQAGQGAVGGGMAGASIGGPWGAAIGAGLGGLLGGAGGDPKADQKSANANLEAQRIKFLQRGAAPQIGATQAGGSDFRRNQVGLISQLEAMSQGRGPSLAGQQLRAATDRNQASQASFANSGRGGPLAALAAANNSGRLGAQAGQDSATARIQEQQMAMNLLGLNLHGARGQDQDLSQFNANQVNDTNKANLEAKLRHMGMSDDAILRILSMQSGNANAAAAQPGVGTGLLAGGAGSLMQGMTQKGATGGGAGGGFGGYGNIGNAWKATL